MRHRLRRSSESPAVTWIAPCSLVIDGLQRDIACLDMSKLHESEPGPGERCLARSVADAMAQEPGLEAVTIDLNRKAISVATIGRNVSPELNGRIAGTIRHAQEFPIMDGAACCLPPATAAPAICLSPTSTQNKISIERRGDAMTIARVTCPTAPKFWRWRDVPWPKVVPRDVEFIEDPEHWTSGSRSWGQPSCAACLGLTGYFLSGTAWSMWAYALAFLTGGWYPAEEVWERLQKRTLDVHFLMLAVAAGSASIGAWGEGAMLLFLFSFSGALEHYALGRTQREIHSLFRNAPKVALVVDESGHEREVPVEQLRPGMRLLVKPDTHFPVDAEVAKGQTASDESNLTGEAAPVEKAVGDQVFAGTLNLWGAVEAVVLRPARRARCRRSFT